MQDFLPPRSGGLRALADAAARVAELFGYRYVETPTLEPTELFKRTAGETSDVVQKEMYTFEDRGGRQLTLRPEATAGIVRALLAHPHDLPVPFKAYTVGPMWRYGRPQSGRYREFRQFDVEVIGAPEPAADVEVIAVGDRFLRGSGLEGLRLEVNSIGDEVCRPAYREQLIAYLEDARDRLRDEHRDRFRDNPLRVLDCKDEACRAVAEGAPKISDHLCGPCAEHFGAVREGLRDEGVEFVHQPTLVRGLDYYTRTAFEFVAAALSEGQGTVCGGGRYDGLAEVLGGPPTPGVGFASGLDRILVAVEAEGRSVPGIPRLECFVVAVGPAGEAVAGDVVRRLREAGVPAMAPFDHRSLKGQLRSADRHGARTAVIVGEREAEAGTVTLRRLDDGHQEEVAMEEAVARLAAGLGDRVPTASARSDDGS
jgi:histidyl-tRNA synthetase